MVWLWLLAIPFRDNGFNVGDWTSCQFHSKPIPYHPADDFYLDQRVVSVEPWDG